VVANALRAAECDVSDTRSQGCRERKSTTFLPRPALAASSPERDLRVPPPCPLPLPPPAVCQNAAHVLQQLLSRERLLQPCRPAKLLSSLYVLAVRRRRDKRDRHVGELPYLLQKLTCSPGSRMSSNTTSDPDHELRRRERPIVDATSVRGSGSAPRSAGCGSSSMATTRLRSRPPAPAAGLPAWPSRRGRPFAAAAERAERRARLVGAVRPDAASRLDKSFAENSLLRSLQAHRICVTWKRSGITGGNATIAHVQDDLAAYFFGRDYMGLGRREFRRITV
jgi:hypothetical protein